MQIGAIKRLLAVEERQKCKDLTLGFLLWRFWACSENLPNQSLQKGKKDLSVRAWEIIVLNTELTKGTVQTLNIKKSIVGILCCLDPITLVGIRDCSISG